jgi:hypothetical protein
MTGLVRLALRLDAVVTGAVGLAMVVAGTALDGPLGIPAAALVVTGAFFAGWFAALWYLASRPRISAPAVWAVIAVNLLWAIDSVAVLLAGWFPLTALGTAVVVVQAVAVAAFADLQFVGLRRVRGAAG